MAIFSWAKWQYVIGLYFCFKMGISCKFYTNGQWMMLYMLIVYNIHVECVNIICD
jgi:hypothetical protein